MIWRIFAMFYYRTEFTIVILKYLKAYPLSLLCITAILLLSMLPFPHIKLAENVPLADKWTHMVMYGGLSLCIWGEYLHSHKFLDGRRLLLFGILSPILLGGILELAQAYLTTTRSGEWLDLAADAIGTVIGAVIAFLVYKSWSLHKR